MKARIRGARRGISRGLETNLSGPRLSVSGSERGGCFLSLTEQLFINSQVVFVNLRSVRLDVVLASKLSVFDVMEGVQTLRA